MDRVEEAVHHGEVTFCDESLYSRPLKLSKVMNMLLHLLLGAVLIAGGTADFEEQSQSYRQEPRGFVESLTEMFGNLGNFQSAINGGLEQVSGGLSEASRFASLVGGDLAEGLGPARGWAGGQLRQSSGLIEGLMRMLGVDSDKLGVMALNALIYLAEWITNSVLGESNTVESRSGAALLDWLMDENVGHLSAIVQRAQQPSLPKTMIESLIDRTGNDTACVQLLICKMSPVVWGAQSAVKQSFAARSVDGSLFESFYQFLPSMTDFERYSESCEGQFPACPLINVSDEDDFGSAM
ncbi:hypothetical protein FJT64_010443 [Amphibalanus amphitrite]|uniref:Uncharacterized protein n=2 Tax=Amphibalanus amphitrite TaxID=1232801 RepID=A0A6A4VC69_AMPAM|nr:hypothetical protein FJT64_010443 [Amphibalanus amphitrite]